MAVAQKQKTSLLWICLCVGCIILIFPKSKIITILSIDLVLFRQVVSNYISFTYRWIADKAGVLYHHDEEKIDYFGE